MSKISDLILDIDEELYEAMNKRVENADLLNIAKKLKVPFDWVDCRYKELLEDW